MTGAENDTGVQWGVHTAAGRLHSALVDRRGGNGLRSGTAMEDSDLAEPTAGADAFQRPLRSRFRQQLSGPFHK
jgi:hypothetical protein